jgi:hypothetical protein
MILIYKFNNEPGFGDNLRGLISILQVQELLPFELFIDFRQHVFSKYFLYDTPAIVSKSQYAVSYKFGHELNHHQQISNDLRELFQKYEIITVSTDAYPDEENISENMKTYIKNLLIVRPEIQDYIKERLSKLASEYHLYHFRLGDECWYNDSMNKDFYIQKFLQSKKENSVLISDSLSLK